MDTLTQGLLGAAAAQAVLGPRLGHRAWIAGMAGGMLPDADIFLSSFADPALPLQLHRHFTHAFLLAPVLGLLAGLALLVVPKMRPQWQCVLGAATLGALTHAPLDLCTSYGTKVGWPFTHHNFTLDLYPIIDPLFTLALLLGVWITAKTRTRVAVLAAFVFLGCYTGLALHQKSRAQSAQQALAASRGHTIDRGRVMPMPGSLMAWRSLYETDGVLHADVVRPPLDGNTQWQPGGSAPVATAMQAALRKPTALTMPRLNYVWEEFVTFADGYVVWDEQDPRLLGDVRFSTSSGLAPIWGVRMDDDGDMTWTRPDRDLGPAFDGLWSLIWGTSPDLRDLPAPPHDEDS